MLQKTLSILLAVTWCVSFGQQQVELVWAQKFGHYAYDNGASIKVAPSGYIYVVGFFDQTVDFDPGPETYELDSDGARALFILKLDADGSFIWVKNLNGGIIADHTSMDIDSEENVYVTCKFRQDIQYDPDGINLQLTAQGNNDLFLMKLNTDGEFEWIKTLGAPDTNPTILRTNNLMTISSEDEIYLTGEFSGTRDFDPGPSERWLTSNGEYNVFVVKFNADGEHVWSHSFGGTFWDTPSDIQTDVFGNVIVCGTFYGSVDFNPGPDEAIKTSFNYDDVFVLKLDAAGNYLWCRTLQNEFSPWIRSVATDPAGDIYLSGSFETSTDFDPGPANSATPADWFLNAYLLKLSSEGSFVWVRTIHGENALKPWSICVDDNFNIYTTGYSSFGVDFDPGSGVYIPDTTEWGYADLFIQKLDYAGNLVWAATMGGSIHDEGFSIVVDEENHVLVTGVFSGVADFDPGPSEHEVAASGAFDAFVLKLKQTETVTAIGEPTIYPNPSSGNYFIDLKGTKPERILIYDLRGRLVHEDDQLGSPYYLLELNEASGSYILKLVYKDHTEVHKVIKT